MDLFSSFSTIMDIIKSFGFPLFVAIWALWKLDRSWGKTEQLQSKIDKIENSVDRVEQKLDKNTESQAEIATSINFLYAATVQKSTNEDEDKHEED